MLTSCKYCGKIHDTKYDCGQKPKQTSKKMPTDLDRFRWTKAWQRKREQTKERDKHMCMVCKANMYMTTNQYNTEDLSVHHIVPLAQAFDKRLDDDNLITLCSYHHDLAERGEIPKEVLQHLVKQAKEDDKGIYVL